ncbi:hypothetical protein TL16_g06883 [Triparma laevis f. inornata]|uniref:Uncharacterized protein n=1 Tax=Triparma laevis f. inornata TaxID=1714386 RepID=A0A9W7AQD5_9STRA|nr:hypothetical protein TL16_g06883 [Triparma laevis f. inornata]
MFNNLPTSARKARTKALARNILFNRFCSTPGFQTFVNNDNYGNNIRNAVTPSPVPSTSTTSPSSAPQSIDQSDLQTPSAAVAPEPILISDSQSSYDSISSITFLPHHSSHNPTPYLLVHSTDSRVIEINRIQNRIQEGESPVAVYQSGMVGEIQAIKGYNISPTEFHLEKSSRWRGSLALGFGDGKLECVDVENVGGDVKVEGGGGFANDNKTISSNNITTPPPFFAASLSSTSSGEPGVLSLYDGRDLKKGQPILTASIMKGIEEECEKIGADRYVRGFGVLDDRSIVTTHDKAGESGKGFVMVWDARMLGSGVASTSSCEDHFEFSGQCKGLLEVGRVGPGHFNVGGMGEENDDGGVAGRVLGLHLGRRQIWDVNSAVNVKNRLWAIARGGEFYVSVVGVKDNEFDEDVCMGRLGVGVVPGGEAESRSSSGVGKKRKLGGGEDGKGTDRIEKLGKGHEYTITKVCFADDDTMFATGDSFGHLFVHKAWSGGQHGGEGSD